ncbi:MAG: hypothetical protein WC516_04195 [Patescibacteria group bacterium]
MNDHAVPPDGDPHHPKDEAGDPHHPNRRTYVITHDLPDKISSLRSIGLRTPEPNDPAFRMFLDETRNGIDDRIRKAFGDGGVDVRSIAAGELADEILAQAMSERPTVKDCVVVSTCPEIAARRRGITLEVNRIINPVGEIIGIGARPGYHSIGEQINGIIAATHGQPLVIAEDGTFTGNTMVHLLQRLQERRIKVAAIVIGFGFPKALDNIRTAFDGDVIVVEHISDFVDWMPIQDFMPFTPNCGRVLGHAWNGRVMPLYTHEGASYATPYVLPFCPMSDWTSIPQDSCHELSCFCVDQTRKLFGLLDGLNGHRITIGELIHSRPRVSIPMSVGRDQSGFPHLDVEVSDYLSDLRQEMS